MGQTKTTIIAAIATTIVSCSGNMTAGERFKTDSVKFEQKDTATEISLKADFATQGNEALTNTIAEYISEQLGGTYTGTLANGDSIVNYYGNVQRDSLLHLRKEYGPSAGMPYFFSCEIKIACETNKYVSYTTYTETFLGGAHGTHSFSGVTFRKTDGRRFGWEMLRNTDSEGFHALIKNGLMRYFNDNTTLRVKTDRDLKACLLVEDDVNYLPLPRTVPYLTKDGVTFVYQSYEIASYAAGMPQFTVPYRDISPYLTSTASNLIE